MLTALRRPLSFTMSWATALWDQLENLDKHTQWGIDFLEKYAKFVKERMEIEQTYVKQLRNLAKKFCSKQSKEDEPKFSCCLSFHAILSELNDYAGHREVIAQELGDKLHGDLMKYSQELKNDRKQYLQDWRKAQQHIEQQLKQMESDKKKFEREWKEAEKLQLRYEKLEIDMNVTKADVEKAKNQLSAQLQVVEENKEEYIIQLQSFNEEQRKYFNVTLVQICQKLQEMDERRSVTLGESYKSLGQLEQRVSPAISKCFQGMVNAGKSVDAKKDSEMVVQLYKSGLETPGDYCFEDFSQVSARTRTSSACTINGPKLDGVLPDRKIILGKARIKLSQWKRQVQFKTQTPNTSSLSLEDYSHLSPEQSCKKLQQRIDQLYKDLRIETNYRDGLTKMKEGYEKKPQLGDTTTLDTKMSESLVNIEHLRLEISKAEKLLLEMKVKQSADARKHHSSGDNIYMPYSMESPEESLYEDVIIVACQEFDDDHFEYDNIKPLSAGCCRALYDFDGQAEGSLIMKANEMLYVIEKDKGDGWTRARNCSGHEGFVPTSYLEIKDRVQ
ncbi:formin-binding protein 1-like [Scleropages formosus]|uniref:Formin binding protein 1 like n=2 Tax=Scleropages formosus TaxID=113540 RepID=A0A8C9W9T9_SCLFO|nr:formin-binding protein 1-like [Scleropages formosus]